MIEAARATTTPEEAHDPPLAPCHRPPRRDTPVAVVVLIVALLAAGCSGSSSSAPRRATPRRVGVAPGALVNPFMGTGVGGAAVGDIDASPAAAVPFGMMQWGPDTSPDRAAGGGYHDGDTALSGFSLTHLNGPGCPALRRRADPADGRRGRRRRPRRRPRASTRPTQHAAPGRYSVALGEPAIGVDLAVTTRTGLARFTFPTDARSRTCCSRSPTARPAPTAAHAEIVGDREITGSVTSGHFCDTPGTYTLSFDAQFDRPFRRFATWQGARTSAGSPHARRSALGRDGHVRHHPRSRRRHEGRHLVRERRQRAREPRRREPRLERRRGRRAAATTRWNAMLGRIAVARRHAGRAADLLLRAVPLAAAPERVQRRRTASTRASTAHGPHRAPATRSTPTSRAGTSTDRRSSCSR